MPTMSSKVTTRVLLASDDTITRAGLRSLFLQAHGIGIIGEAKSMMDAPQKVRELAPDVVLIEITIPGRADGLRSATEIAQLSSKARVLVLTNNSDLPYVRSMLAAGVSGYLLKSSEVSQLFAAIRTVSRGGNVIDMALGADLVWHVIEKKNKKEKPTFSQRELQILKSLVRGYTNAQLAQVFKLSVKTVETYRVRLYRKLRVGSRAELVEYALANRLLVQQ